MMISRVVSCKGFNKIQIKLKNKNLSRNFYVSVEMFASVPELKKGDIMTIDWVPTGGTLVYLNGKK